MRRDQQRLLDMLEALDSVANMVAQRNESEFIANETLCYAVAQRLTIVGEAASRVSAEVWTNIRPSLGRTSWRSAIFWRTNISESIGLSCGKPRPTTPQRYAVRSLKY
jgi:uncharacterized protein with HEPN domain